MTYHPSQRVRLCHEGAAATVLAHPGPHTYRVRTDDGRVCDLDEQEIEPLGAGPRS